LNKEDLLLREEKNAGRGRVGEERKTDRGKEKREGERERRERGKRKGERKRRRVEGPPCVAVNFL